MNKAPYLPPKATDAGSPRSSASSASARFSRFENSRAPSFTSTIPTRTFSHRSDAVSTFGLEDDGDVDNRFIPTNIGQTRMIIAIDYGTTFTGVAYATPDNEYADINMVTVLQSWGERMGNSLKIPSVISYTPCTTEYREQFGLDISDDAVTMVNTKLELEPQDTRMDELDLIIQVLDGTRNLQFTHVKASRGYPEYTWKGPGEIVEDYLTKVFKQFQRSTEYLSEIKIAVPVDIVITVPVGWSYQAKNSTLKAVRGAGFNHENFPNLNKYYLITEPEAASIYTIKFLKQCEAESLRKGDCFVLCDAGGGTVDVVGYRATQLDPKVALQAITVPTGAKCGSTFINEKFRKWLLQTIGGKNYDLLNPRSEGQRLSGNTMEGPKLRKVMKEFEILKKGFSSASTDMHIDLPEPLHELSYGKRVDQGELTITMDDMKKLFDDYIDDVIELIQGQIDQVEARRLRVKSVFLIGGFSESPYLHEELRNSLDMRELRLRRPGTSWSAVVRGAVLFGMEKSDRQNEMAITPSPKSYGSVGAQRFSKRSHNTKDLFTDPLTGTVKAKGQLTWFVRKGDMLGAPQSRTVKAKFYWQFQAYQKREIELPIYQYPDDDIPTRFETAHEELEIVSKLTVDLSKFPLIRFDKHRDPATGLTWYRVSLICKVTLNGFTLRAELLWDNEVMAQTSIDIIDS